MAAVAHLTRPAASILEHPPWEVVWRSASPADVLSLSSPWLLPHEAALTALAWVTAAAAWRWGPSRRLALLMAAMPVGLVLIYHAAYWRWQDRLLSLAAAFVLAWLVAHGSPNLRHAAILLAACGAYAISVMAMAIGAGDPVVAYRLYAACYVGLQVVLTLAWLSHWRHPEAARRRTARPSA